MAETVTTTLVRAFEPVSGTSARGDWTRCDFKDEQDRKFSTFKGDVASVATSLIGKPVELEFIAKENGEYTNRTLLKVTPVNGVVAAVTPVDSTDTVHIPVTQNAGVSYDDTRQLRIMRQSALDRALTAYGIAQLDPIESIDEVYKLSDEFIDYFVNGISE
jgi:hypothetical protein